MAPDPVRPEPDPPRWLADAMLGKLARYLRFLGHDTEYVRAPFGDGRGVDPREPGRILLTRNHALAAKSEPSFLLRSPEVRQQLREVHERFPSAPFEPRFDRCPECNAPLRPWSPPVDGAAWPQELPVALVRSGLAVAECPACQRHFWEGSHAHRIRAVIAEAIAPEATP